VANPGDCSCVTFARHSYLFCPGATNWAFARARCREKGTDLAIITSAQENAFLLDHAGGMTRWIGANDRGESGISATLDCSSRCSRPGGSSTEGLWTWVDGPGNKERGAVFCEASPDSSKCPATSGGYANWSANEPTNAGNCTPFAECHEGEDCGALEGASGTWQDNTCGSNLPFICETY
jgi:hypothetical protein